MSVSGSEQKRALSGLGGPTRVRGNEAYAFALREAFEAVDGEELAIHDVHSYPARMHPGVARVAIERFMPGPRATLLDPFCGGGTTLVEGMRAGMRCLGSDLNPLAIELSRVKTRRLRKNERERFAETMAELAARSEARVRGRVDVRARLDASERAHYEVHVLKELAGLLAEIDALEDPPTRAAARMVFSSIVVKFSRQRSDTDERAADKRIRKGLVTEFFARKAAELERAWAELDAACPPRTRRPRIVRADATSLRDTLSGDFRADLVLTSPPYGGTYDYVRHHARRFAWLGMRGGEFARKEIGARRSYARGSQRDAAQRWDAELGAALAQIAASLAPEGIALLLIGDGDLAGQRVPADAQLERLGADCGLELIACASQPRSDRRSGAPREEHLVALAPRA